MKKFLYLIIPLFLTLLSHRATLSKAVSNDSNLCSNYLDPVVLNYENGKYQMYTYDTGTVIMMIIPKHI